MFPRLHGRWWPETSDSIWGFFQASWLPTQIAVFLIGILTFHVLRSQTCRRLGGDLGWSLCLLAASGLILMTARHGGQGGFVPAYIVIVLALVLFLISISGGVVPLVVNPVVCQVGKLSYSCYLVHFAVLGRLCSFFKLPLDAAHPKFDAGSGGSNFLLFVKLSTMTLVITTLISFGTLQGIENPGIALGKRVIRFMSARKPEVVSERSVPV